MKFTDRTCKREIKSQLTPLERQLTFNKRYSELSVQAKLSMPIRTVMHKLKILPITEKNYNDMENELKLLKTEVNFATSTLKGVIDKKIETDLKMKSKPNMLVDCGI